MHSQISPPVESKNLHVMAWLLVAAALLINLWFASRHWTSSLLDAHEFRQVQTAITAHFIKETGFKLAYETPVLGPPWSVPMEFPTYQLGVAYLSKFTGLPLEQSGRLLSILCFYVSLPSVWLLLGKWRFSSTVRCCVLAALLTCPILTFYNRTFLIESMALGLSLWFLWSFWAALEGQAFRRLPLVWIFGALAALTKITTFAVFCLPAGFLTLAFAFEWRQRRPAIRSWRAGFLAVGGLAVPILAGLAWVAYSDHVKSLNPYASFLASSKLHDWNWGTLAQRLTGEFWSTIYLVTSRNVVSEPALLLLLGLIPGLARTIQWRIAICVFLYFSGCLLFANLYFVHDYYSYATAGFLATALGIAAGSLLEEGKVSKITGWALFMLALVSQIMAFTRGYGTFYNRPNAPVPPFAEIIRRTTAPSDVLVAFGLDWNGVIPYHAERRAMMVPHHLLDDRDAFKKALDGFGTLRAGAVIIAGTLRNSPEFVIPRLRQFDMESFPIASTDEMDLYLRADLHERARGELRGNHYPGVIFQLERKPLQLEHTPETLLDGLAWNGKFTMALPAPYAYRSPFSPVIGERDSQAVINTHAPMEFLFHAAPGARRVEASGGMVPDAYSNGNVTDGVVLQILEEFPDGRRQLLVERELKPMTRPADRAEVTLEYLSERAYMGVIVLRVDPGSMGNINCDWCYWRNVKIH